MDKKLDGQAIEQINQITRDRIGISTLERYTGSLAEEFQPYILLTNFKAYVDYFSHHTGNELRQGSVMRSSHCKKRRISIIDFSVGSPVAALVIELISFIKPKAAIMLGMCGGLRANHQIGDFFNPVAAIREEGTSNAFLPPQCPALSSFEIQKFIVDEIERRGLSYHTGVIHTTNVRFWEFNETFRNMLAEERVHAIDMECATLFSVGFAKYVPVGALMLISDLPLDHSGIKTASSAKVVFKEYTELHITMGMNVLSNLQSLEGTGFNYQF